LLIAGTLLIPGILKDFFFAVTAKLKGIALEPPEGISTLKQRVFSIFLPTNLLIGYGCCCEVLISIKKKAL